MDCKSTIQQIIELGHTDINEYSDEVRKHLETCSRCSSLLRKVSETMEEIEKSNPDYLPDFTESILAKTGYRRTQAEKSSIYERLIVPISSIAAIFIGVLLGIALTSGQSQETAEENIESEIFAMILTSSTEIIPDALIQND